MRALTPDPHCGVTGLSAQINSPRRDRLRCTSDLSLRRRRRWRRRRWRRNSPEWETADGSLGSTKLSGRPRWGPTLALPGRARPVLLATRPRDLPLLGSGGPVPARTRVGAVPGPGDTPAGVSAGLGHKEGTMPSTPRPPGGQW